MMMMMMMMILVDVVGMTSKFVLCFSTSANFCSCGVEHFTDEGSILYSQVSYCYASVLLSTSIAMPLVEVHQQTVAMDLFPVSLCTVLVCIGRSLRQNCLMCCLCCVCQRYERLVLVSAGCDTRHPRLLLSRGLSRHVRHGAPGTHNLLLCMRQSSSKTASSSSISGQHHVSMWCPCC